MQNTKAAVLLVFLFAFKSPIPAQDFKKDSFNLKKSEYNGINVSCTNWIHKNSLNVNIEWNFINDSTFIRTKIWPEDRPKYDVGRYKIDKTKNNVSIEWRCIFSTGSFQNISYSIPQFYNIVKWTEKEIILKKQTAKGAISADSLTENNPINLIRRQ